MVSASPRPRRPLVWSAALSLAAAGTVLGGVAARRWLDPYFQMTPRDFLLPGTQIGEVSPAVMLESTNCQMCHGFMDDTSDPAGTWSGSLMALAGRDPLFFAQMATANQDVANAGTFCMRCHIPNTFVTGHATDPTGATLDRLDLDGVSCHFCHSMVDPVYRPGISPVQDQAILAGLQAGAPEFYANSMFVLDPTGTRRGPRTDTYPPHQLLHSPFHTSGNFCGTCHDVGNVAVSRLPDGTYRYNAIDQPTPSQDPAHQFPLERTFTEWKLSAFASGGVDMGGRFGGSRGPVVSTCQDCHMPKTTGQACFFGPERPDLARHDFSGAAAQVLDLIDLLYIDTAEVDHDAIARGRARAVEMLRRAATLTVSREARVLRIRVTNESGHKLPTGHIEGRRVWVGVTFRDASGAIVAQRGRYNTASAELDEHTTTVYEMHVGLSDAASRATGLPAGQTGHMALADTIVKDNRIPPRGFDNAAYEAGGAPAVGHLYDDGQYWDDVEFPLPAGAVRAEVTLNYQQTPKHYIEELRDHNYSNDWGEVLHQLWVQTGRGAPIAMAEAELDFPAGCPADWNGDGGRTTADVAAFATFWHWCLQTGSQGADVDGNGRVEPADIASFVNTWWTGC